MMGLKERCETIHSDGGGCRHCTRCSYVYVVGSANAKVDCGPVVNKGNELARSVGHRRPSPAGTGAFSLGIWVWRRWRVRRHRIIAKVQPYAGPNTFVPLLESGELEFGMHQYSRCAHGR